MNGRRIGPVDTIWLNMDRPNNLMVIDALVLFEGRVDWDRVVAVLHQRLLGHFPVFTQRPVPPRAPFGLPRWVDDRQFAIERHIRRVRLAAPGTDAVLQRYVERHMSRPLDRSHPLWEVHFIDGHRGASAIYFRLHHSLADGIALTRLMLSLTDTTPDGTPSSVGRSRAGARSAVAGAEDLLPGAIADEEAPAVPRGLVNGVARTAAAVLTTAGSAASGAARVVSHLPPPGRLAGELAVQAGRTAATVNKLLLTQNPLTVLNREPGIAKRAVWSRAFQLPEVKRAGRIAGATVNDVLMSAVSGAIATYLADHGEVAIDLSTMVPVNVRPLNQPLPRELGNRFALVIVKLPVGVTAPLARLAETKRRMDLIKHSVEAILTYGLINAIGRAVPGLDRPIVDFFARKAVGVTTNVIGPPAARYLAGSKVAGLLAWAPGSGRQTLGVCIVTYNNTVRVGFKVDADTVRDPEHLVAAFDSQLRALLRVGRAATRAA